MLNNWDTSIDDENDENQVNTLSILGVRLLSHKQFESKNARAFFECRARPLYAEANERKIKKQTREQRTTDKLDLAYSVAENAYM